MDTKIQERAQLWKENVDEPELAAELADLLAKDDDSIVDAFYRDLEFGTAGLRGVLGVGTNRMNVYTVSQATQGWPTTSTPIARTPPSPSCATPATRATSS